MPFPVSSSSSCLWPRLWLLRLALTRRTREDWAKIHLGLKQMMMMMMMMGGRALEEKGTVGDLRSISFFSLRASNCKRRLDIKNALDVFFSDRRPPRRGPHLPPGRLLLHLQPRAGLPSGDSLPQHPAALAANRPEGAHLRPHLGHGGKAGAQGHPAGEQGGLSQAAQSAQPAQA